MSEKNGKAMNFTVAVVDEGLLDLTRFKTPEPWNTFYAREALGVKSWDMYEDVLGAFSGKMAALLKVGGDGELMGKKGGNKANRFKPMVKYFGPYSLDVGGTKSIDFKMPNYVGSVRTMVIAGDKGAYGSAEKATPVKEALMVVATLPRVLSPGEKVKLPVTVFAMDKKIKNVSVEVKPNSKFKLSGDAKKSLSFSAEGEKTIAFDFDVAEQLGKGKVQIIAKSGSESATYEIELDVRAPNPRTVDVISKVLEGGESWNSNYTLPGISGTNEAVLEVSSIPPINLDQRLKYLIKYPHGCIEQTTSSVFPQLFLDRLTKLNDETKNKIKNNIQSGIDRLKSFQTNDGGFAYWPGQGQSNNWGSSYAGHFLLEAKELGYMVPASMLKNWTKYQKNQSSNWTRNSQYGYNRGDFLQAYRLYTLALAGDADLPSMNRLKEDVKLSDEAKWRLAAAYQLAGQEEVASSMVQNASRDVEEYQELSYSYGSRDRDLAMILEALVQMDRKSDAQDVLKKISGSLSNNKRWMSTQTTAYCLMAVGKFVGENSVGKSIKYSYQVGGDGKKNATTDLPIDQTDISVKKKTNSINLTNSGDNVLFVRIITSGIPMAGNETDAENDLVLSVVYKDLDGNTVDPINLEQGTDFKAEVTVKNPGYRGNYKEMALTQIFPSGWEIRNMRLNGDNSSPHFKSVPTYQDIRDDRVMTYFDLRAGNTKTFVVLLNATYEGKYYLPAVNCEAMYDNTISGRKKGQWVTVVKP